MPTTYKTPGVYVEEIATRPASIAQVPSAIPAFIGYTAKRPSLSDEAVHIHSMLEFNDQFGGPPPFELVKNARITLGPDNRLTGPVDTESRFHLYSSLNLFFANGGQSCYVLSAGKFGNTVKKEAFISALSRLSNEDVPSLIVMPDAVSLENNALIEVQQTALRQCADRRDRFAILDIQNIEMQESIKQFRNNIGVTNTTYGSAYTPWLVTSPDRQIRYRDIKGHIFQSGKELLLEHFGTSNPIIPEIDSLLDAIRDVDTIATALEPHVDAAVNYENLKLKFYNDSSTKNEFDALASAVQSLYDTTLKAWAANSSALTTLKVNGAALSATKNAISSLSESLKVLDEVASATSAQLRTIEPRITDAFHKVLHATDNVQREAAHAEASSDDALQNALPVYKDLLADLDTVTAVVPPSGAIAGVYASVDAKRGVWKAPANTNITGVVGLTHSISDTEQAELNVDPNAGLSINTIRAFPGRGILVWGARTLAGNDNEWRYISVRRLFITVEESIKQSSSWVVFEPNDANTWVKVQAMIENYLTELWRQGALAGATTDDAFFVKIGLGASMSPQDILEGKLFIEIGMAVVRPAEFIILKVAHEIQEN